MLGFNVILCCFFLWIFRVAAFPHVNKTVSPLRETLMQSSSSHPLGQSGLRSKQMTIREDLSISKQPMIASKIRSAVNKNSPSFVPAGGGALAVIHLNFRTWAGVEDIDLAADQSHVHVTGELNYTKSLLIAAINESSCRTGNRSYTEIRADLGSPSLF